MKQETNEHFICFCRKYYIRNCDDRISFNEQPYATFEIYFNKNREWLEVLFKNNSEVKIRNEQI